MGRLPFDPAKMAVKMKKPSAAAPAAAASASGDTAAPGETRPLTVSQLAALIDGALRGGLERRLRVVGEISGFSDRTHWYFSLKDAEAVISCIMFASAARASRFRPDSLAGGGGIEVVATGRVEFFAKQGRTQFYVEKLEPVGEGALDLAFRKLCDDLRALGWFDQERKRPLPTFPGRIAVVTSRTSAAYQDVLNTVRRRCPAVDVALVDVRVQGAGAAGEIARALRWLGANHRRLGVEAIIVTRGGGSKEDLWSFNEREVAEAIVRSPVPVVAAIGHETDVSIAELVADERCATPTQAAMRLTPDAAALGEQLDAFAARLGALARRAVRDGERRVGAAERSAFIADPTRLLSRARDRMTELARRLPAATGHALHRRAFSLERLTGRLETNRPAAVYSRRLLELDRASNRLGVAVRVRMRGTDFRLLERRLHTSLDVQRGRLAASLDAMERALDLVGPASVLRRGYSVTVRADGGVVRSVADVRAGDQVRTMVSDGSFGSTVGQGEPGAAPVPDRLVAAAQQRRTERKRRRAEPPGTDQLKLF